MKKLLIIFAVLCIVACEKTPIQVPVNQNTNNYFAVNGLKLNVSRSWFINDSEIGAVSNDATATVLIKVVNSDSIPIQLILNNVLYYNPNACKDIKITNNGTNYLIIGNLNLFEYTNTQNKMPISLNFQTIKK